MADRVGDGDVVDDAALVRDVVAGDERAFAVLYARFEPVARRSAARAARTHPQLDLDEVVNLALTRLWRALPSFDDARELTPWAAVVIAHAVRSAAKATRSMKSSMHWGAMLGPPATDQEETSQMERLTDGVDATAALIAQEEVRLVRAVLHDVLSAREAEVMRLRLAGWTYEEVSDRLGIDRKAVDNAIRRAGEKLRRAFATGRDVEAVLGGGVL